MPALAISLALAAAVMPPLLEGPPETPRTAAGWHLATLPRQTKPVTRFVPERIDGRPAMRIDAETHGERITSAYTSRVRHIVLRNGADAHGTWFDEARDIAADFQQAFGDESRTLPPLLAVLIGGDTDNTGAHSVAHVGERRFEP